LSRACDQGLLTRTGEGTRTDAFRYALSPPPSLDNPSPAAEDDPAMNQ
jgi:hypothetical protein